MSDQIYHASVEARERGERLRRIRNLANLSRRALCDEAGININTFIGYEVGRYGGLTKKGADIIIPYLSLKGVYCSLDWLMNGTGKGPYIIPDMQLGKIDSTTDSIANFSEDQKIGEELLLFRAHYRSAIDYQIIDDGMLPVYKIGSYVAGIPCSGSSIQNIIGFDCIIQTVTNELMVRNLRAGRTKNDYTLTCLNPYTTHNSPVLYDVELLFAAKIIWHREIYQPNDVVEFDHVS